jgi:hypothetical protein
VGSGKCNVVICASQVVFLRCELGSGDVTHKWSGMDVKMVITSGGITSGKVTFRMRRREVNNVRSIMSVGGLWYGQVLFYAVSVCLIFLMQLENLHHFLNLWYNYLFNTLRHRQSVATLTVCRRLAESDISAMLSSCVWIDYIGDIITQLM